MCQQSSFWPLAREIVALGRLWPGATSTLQPGFRGLGCFRIGVSGLRGLGVWGLLWGTLQTLLRQCDRSQAAKFVLTSGEEQESSGNRRSSGLSSKMILVRAVQLNLKNHHLILNCKHDIVLN